jgi:hypothetical protein
MRDIVQKSVSQALTNFINTKMNEIMARINFAREVKYGEQVKVDFVMDMSLPNGGVSAAGEFLSIGSIATSFAPGHRDFPPFQPVALPISQTTPDLANIYISDYIINSATNALHTAGNHFY